VLLRKGTGLPRRSDAAEAIRVNPHLPEFTAELEIMVTLDPRQVVHSSANGLCRAAASVRALFFRTAGRNRDARSLLRRFPGTFAPVIFSVTPTIDTRKLRSDTVPTSLGSVVGRT
jgi:hypothetical protein